MMREHCAAMTTTISGTISTMSKKQAVCTHIGTGTVGLGKEDVGCKTPHFTADRPPIEQTGDSRPHCGKTYSHAANNLHPSFQLH